MNTIYPAMKAIILKNGKVLIMKRSMKEDHAQVLWDIPGGKIDFGEDPIDCLNREVMEESGIKIEIIKLLRVWSFLKDSKTQIIGITMLCKYKSGEVKISEEHTEFKWIKPEEIKKYDTVPMLKESLENVYNYQEEK